MSDQNTSSRTSDESDEINNQVNKLIKKNLNKSMDKYTVLHELKSKNIDEKTIDEIMDKYAKKMNKIKRFAEKFRDRLITKYGSLSHKEYIQKISKYKIKYNLDDSEVQSIMNLLFSSKNTFSNNESQDLDLNYNQMSKALGFIPASYNLGGQLHVRKEELEQLDTILAMDAISKDLHYQVVIQSHMYESCKMVTAGGISRHKMNLYSFIHPVVAALFIPKFKLLDEHMLFASISKIVAQKENGNGIQTQPEYELYWDIATDPAETTCTKKNGPFTDLVNRCTVQHKLWAAVLNLRQGNYYTDDLSSFIMAVDRCNSNIFDAADLTYVKDEGTILRKLLAAFSLRPTTVETRPVYGVSPITSHISSISTSHITKLPLITLRIPADSTTTTPIELKDALTQEQMYIHHKQLSVKKQTVLHSTELLIFYVHRRSQMINHNRLYASYAASTLPIVTSAYDKLSTVQLTFNDEIHISLDYQYEFISAVIVETTSIATSIAACTPTIANDIIYGSSTIIFNKKTPGIITTSTPTPAPTGDDNYYKYKPLVNHTKSTITAVENIARDEAKDEMRQRGTIFIYRLKL